MPRPSLDGPSVASGLEEVANPRWTHPGRPQDPLIRQASATMVLPPSPRGTDDSSAWTAPTGPTTGATIRPPSLSTAIEPSSLVPQAKLVEITQLPRPGYTPNTFSPPAEQTSGNWRAAPHPR
jgi:hypothetical protein